GDVAQLQRVPRPDLGAVPALEQVADPHPRRCQDVTLLAVAVVEQGDAGVAIGVVLDRSHLRRDAVLVAVEVDDAVLLLVAAAAVPGGPAPVAVASARLRLRGEQRLLGLAARYLGEVGDRLEPAAGTGGLALAKRHGVSLPRRARCGRRLRG